MDPIALIKSPKVVAGLVGVVVVGLILLLAYCSGRHDGKQGEVVGQQKREIQVQTQVVAAADNSSAARVTDAVRSDQQQRELHDAIQATNDPDKQRALRGCVILRQQGRDTSRIAVCSGS